MQRLIASTQLSHSFSVFAWTATSNSSLPSATQKKIKSTSTSRTVCDDYSFDKNRRVPYPFRMIKVQPALGEPLFETNTKVDDNNSISPFRVCFVGSDQYSRYARHNTNQRRCRCPKLCMPERLVGDFFSHPCFTTKFKVAMFFFATA